MTEPLFREASYQRELEARVVEARPEGVVLNATIFYARGGGQSGDRGRLRRADGATIDIVDTVYDADKRTILHVPAPGAPLPAPGESVVVELDWDLRYRRMRAHTALHLLSVVLPYPSPAARSATAMAGSISIPARRRSTRPTSNNGSTS
jgi:misacylated tRNA(Ala) deacylase